MAWLVRSDIHFLDLIMINPKTNKLPFPKITWHSLKVCLIKKGIFLPTVYSMVKGYHRYSIHRGLKLDGAIGQGEICNSLKRENFQNPSCPILEKIK